MALSRSRLVQGGLAGTLAAAAIAVVVVLSQSGFAEAATSLPHDTLITANNAQPTDKDYSFSTTRRFWSVVLLNTSENDPTDLDYDLAVRKSGTTLATSSQSFPQLDFVAINSHLRAPQSYTARVHRFRGSSSGAQYTIEYTEGSKTFPAGRTVMSASSRPVFIRDLPISAGQTVNVSVAKDIPFCPNGIGPDYFHVFLM